MASIQQDMAAAAAAGSEGGDAVALRAQVRELEMDQQLMQRDMEELSRQAEDAILALRCATLFSNVQGIEPLSCWGRGSRQGPAAHAARHGGE